MKPDDKKPALSVVPDDATDDAEEPETFTFEQLLLRNGGLVRKLIDETDLDDQAAVMLFVSTLQIHMQAVHARQMQGAN